MKIAMIGYGKMGKEIEKVAIERNHEISLIIDVNDRDKFTPENLSKCDVAIEFSVPESAYNNILQCFKAGLPVVSGTTGWLDKLDDIRKRCEGDKQSFLYASNFSIGVNILFALNKYLARIMNRFNEYTPSLEETHHIHKKDAPSGTAITLGEDLIKESNKLKSWKLNTKVDDTTLPIVAKREDEVPGTHNIRYDSIVDSIDIIHKAKSRAGFALGAVLAAEYLHDKKGFHGMNDLLKLEE